MSVEMEFAGFVLRMAIAVIVIAVIAIKSAKSRKAAEWDRVYGNTDFTNPYR